MPGPMSEEYGPFVRLWGIQQSQLPPAAGSKEDLVPFLESRFDEATTFISSLPPSPAGSTRSPWRSKGVKTFPNAVSPVHLFERTVRREDLAEVVQKHHPPGVTADKLEAETWVLRWSLHEDAPAKGTASWAEWVQCFKLEHAEAEKDFTPTVESTTVLQQWDCAGIEVDVAGETWTDWTLKREESVHKLPEPLHRRVFPVLQATASVRGRRGFLIVQVALAADGADKSHADGLVRGAYTSIERLQETEAGIEWIMGIASDAGGLLPGWLQRVAVPGQVAKDVDLFLGWIAKEDQGGEGDGDVLGNRLDRVKTRAWLSMASCYTEKL